MCDCVPNPFGGLGRAKFVEHEDFCLKNGPKDSHFGGCYARIVAILDLLEKVAIIAKKACCATLSDQTAKDPDGEMGFSDADAADKHQTCIGGLKGVPFDKLPCPHVCGPKSMVCTGEIGLIVFKRAVFVSLWDAAMSKRAVLASPDAALAGARDLPPVLLHDAQP